MLASREAWMVLIPMTKTERWSYSSPPNLSRSRLEKTRQLNGIWPNSYRLVQYIYSKYTVHILNQASCGWLSRRLQMVFYHAGGWMVQLRDWDDGTSQYRHESIVGCNQSLERPNGSVSFWLSSTKNLNDFALYRGQRAVTCCLLAHYFVVIDY